MKKTSKQTAFDFAADPPRDPVQHMLDVDFSLMPPGRLVGDKLRCISCPVCGSGCLAKQSALEWRFVHRGSMLSTAKSAKYQPVRWCKLSIGDFALAVGRGEITVDRHGAIVATKPPAAEAVAR